MPIFHFNIADHGIAADAEGTELPDAIAARKQAIVFAGDYLSDDPDLVWDGRDFKVEVTDAHGRALFVVVMLAIDTSDGRAATGQA